MNNTYPSYIDVNQKWVKQIPSHWEIKRLKAVFAMRKERNDPVVTSNILSLTAKQGVVPYAEKEGTGGNKPKEDLTKYNIAHENDLLVNCMNVVSGAAGVSRYYGAISPVYYALYPHGDQNVWYFHHIFRLLPFQRSLIGLGKGILMHESDNGTLTSVRMRISMDYLGSVVLPVPPREEQDQIVRFLDWKVSEINRLINIKRKEIARLEELKKAVISHAVTRGLNPDVELKDSGLEWLDEIPEHWEKSKLKWICTMKSGDNLVSQQINPNEGTYLVYGGNGIRGYYNDYNTEGCFLLIGRQGALCGNVHKVIGKIWATDHAVVTKTNNRVSIDYVFYLLIHMNLNQYANDAAAQPGLSVGKILNLVTIVPPIEEQIDIGNYLNKKCSEIDTIIENKHSQIKALQEFKTRLISDVVTGKIDVRGIEIPEYEYTAEEADTDSEAEAEELDEGGEEE